MRKPRLTWTWPRSSTHGTRKMTWRSGSQMRSISLSSRYSGCFATSGPRQPRTSSTACRKSRSPWLRWSMRAWISRRASPRSRVMREAMGEVTSAGPGPLSYNRPMPPSLRLLGAHAAGSNGSDERLPSEMPASLLVYLAVRGGWVDRRELAFLYRPDAREDVALAYLRKLVFRARRFDWASDLE